MIDNTDPDDYHRCMQEKRKNLNRVIYRNWIVALGREPCRIWRDGPRPADHFNQEIITAVNQAINSLDREEAWFIRAYHFQGMSYPEIGKIMGHVVHKLESLHRQALKKMKRQLQVRLGGKYNIPPPVDPACALCNHPQVEEINDLIRTKTERETWRRITRTLHDKYGIVMSSIQGLIGHQKYHMI
jgi:hypothetical protein